MSVANQASVLPQSPAPIPILELPNSRIPEQPPPPNKLLFCLNNNIDTRNIHIWDPITNDNVPDSELAWAGVTSLNCLHQVLLTPFNSPEPILGHEDWLRFVLDIVATIHEGLNQAQLTPPDHAGPSAKLADIANGFSELDANEIDLVSTIEEVLDWIHAFFIHHDECYPANSSSRPVSMLCYHCMESSRSPFTKADNQDKITSILVSVDFDARATKDTLLNEAIRGVHKEVDEWRITQRNHILKAIVDTVISDDEPTTETLTLTAIGLDERLRNWVESKWEDLQSYARKKLAGDVGTDTIDQRFQELIEERLFHRCKELEADVVSRTNALQASFDAEVASMAAAFQYTLDAEKCKLTAALATEKSKLQADFDANILAFAHNSPKTSTADQTLSTMNPASASKKRKTN